MCVQTDDDDDDGDRAGPCSGEAGRRLDSHPARAASPRATCPRGAGRGALLPVASQTHARSKTVAHREDIIVDKINTSQGGRGVAVARTRDHAVTKRCCAQGRIRTSWRHEQDRFGGDKMNAAMFPSLCS